MGKLIRRARKANQVVAAGPKTAGGVVGVSWCVLGRGGEGMLGKGRGREGKGEGGGLPPPYNAIRPVRARLCLEGPTFSIACCAITSPVAKSTCHHTHPSAPEAP